MDVRIIKEIMKDSNKWWASKFKVEGFKERGIYTQLLKYLNKKQIIAISGLRRVGKTTLMLKLIEELLIKNEGKNILYFSFDETSDIRIREIIRIYEELADVRAGEGKLYLFFDEIQKVDSWEGQIKGIYDTYPNIKIVISGSESLFIRKKSRESLAGRMFDFRVSKLTFKEFLIFRNFKIYNPQVQSEAIKRELKKYIVSNGFPEIIGEEPEFCRKYITEGIIEKIIYRDLAEMLNIRDAGLLNSIFRVIYDNPGNIIEINDLANELNATRQKISQYLYFLEESFLIKKLYNYSRNRRKIERKLKKYYPAIINPNLIRIEFGKVFENFIILELACDFFWRDSYKNEVDAVLTKEKILPIEIKSGKINRKNIKGLEVFAKKFKCKDKLVISYNDEAGAGNVKIVTFYEYLLR